MCFSCQVQGKAMLSMTHIRHLWSGLELFLQWWKIALDKVLISQETGGTCHKVLQVRSHLRGTACCDFFLHYFKTFQGVFLFLIKSMDHVGPGQSPQERLARWSLASVTDRSSNGYICCLKKRKILIHRTTNRHVSSVIPKVVSTLRASPTVP